MSPDWNIRHGTQLAAIDRCGGGLRCYEVDASAVVDGYPQEMEAPAGAGQILAPWPNRVRDGHYTFGGRAYELSITEPEHRNAIHGLARGKLWEQVGRTSSSITVACVIADEPGYPFRLRLSTTWTLTDDGLTAEHAAQNIGAETAPFGLGVHPYLTIPGIAVDDVDLTVPAEQVLDADARGLPLGRCDVGGTDFDFRAGRRVGTQHIDHAFTSLAGDRTVRLSAADALVELWLGDAFPWVQVFTADTVPEQRRRRSLAVEPMTCPADAFNSGTDLIRLRPDGSWRGEWGIRRCQLPQIARTSDSE